MNNPHKYICSLIATVMAMLATGCGGLPSGRIAEASRLSAICPDSAYAILRDIDYDALTEDSLRAEYILAKAMTNVRVGRSLITDTLLSDAASYFISAGDTARWVIASQLLSGYDFVRGDSEASLARLEAMAPRIKNRELLWDTYMHLLEISLNSGAYGKAEIYADWLLGHTDVPEQILRFATAKGASRYMCGDYAGALAVLDSVVSAGIPGKVSPGISGEFYCEYAEVLDGAGRSAKAIAVIDSLNRHSGPADVSEKMSRRISLAQFYADAGNTEMAKQLLDSIDHEATKTVFEVYASIAMLNTAIQFKETGRLPAGLMHKVTKNMHRNYRLAQFDRQTAMESVMELNDDNYELRLQRQRLWLLVSLISLLVLVCGVAAYLVLNRRKQRMVEAEERAETLERMLRETEKAEEGAGCLSDGDRLRAVLLRQLGIFKTFAGTPTAQSRDALKKISMVGNDGAPMETLVDWPEFYLMIDNLYDGFHSRLIARYPDTFNDKEQQIIVLLKAGFSTKEIGVLTEQSSATIYTRKSVIRKKLGCTENGDIIARAEE
ncbi:MAG: hypothetical protein K2H83_09110 [Duncaniella sp.]|nr:hypothetical protein [Duncaniella sp.]